MTTTASAEATTGADFRRKRSQVPLPPYDVIYAMDRWRRDAQRLADETIEEGWQTRSFPRVSLDRPVAWSTICSANSAWEYYLHCWEPLGRVLAAHDHTGDLRYLRFSVELILDWWEHHAAFDVESQYAWYDMAIGARSYRLGYVLDAACRRPEFSDREVTELLNCTMRHVEALRDDDRFAAHSNHGFYFAAGQLALARRFAPTLPELQSDVAQARDRLLQLVDDQFASDGIHREHSTDYARMVLSTFENLIDSGLIEGSDFIDRRNLVQDALAWFVMPDGYLTMFGDSPHRAFTLKPSRGDVWYVEPEQIGSQALVFQATGGVRGRPPETSVRAFPDGGFAVVREGWPTGSEDFGDWGYLAQICAFHSRVHKHADDLSFVWYDRGHEILIDPGRFGYGERAKGELKDQGFYYADPRRVYVESTAAHNTVEIDGRSYNRKVERPYGSALRRCGEVGGIAYTEAVVVHAEDVIHERVLLYRPARWLLVLDWVSDPRNKCHDVAQHFHFAPELAVREHKDTVQVELPDRDLLHVVSLDGATGLPVVSGQKRPMRGWISRKDGEIEPCSSTGFRRRGSAVALATLLAFSDLPRPASCRFADDRRAATVEWDAAGLRHRVEIKRNDPFEIAHHVAVERGGGSNRP